MSKKISFRSCLGCRKTKKKEDLLRIVKTPQSKIEVDISGKQNGRGTYICFKDGCARKALKSDVVARALNIGPDKINKQRLKGEIEKILKEKNEKESNRVS